VTDGQTDRRTARRTGDGIYRAIAYMLSRAKNVKNRTPISSFKKYAERLTIACTAGFKTESGAYVTEMIIYDLFIFNLPLATISSFIFGAKNFYSRRIWQEKPAQKIGAKNGVDLSAPVSSGARVVGITMSCRKETARCLHVACEVNFTRSYFDEGSLYNPVTVMHCCCVRS